MRGYTLVEWIFLVAMLAAFSGLIGLFACDGGGGGKDGEAASPAAVPPVVSPLQSKRNQVTCLNNLRQIGGLLIAGGDNRKFRLSGAPFLLQIAPMIKDDQLKVFLCPGEPPVEGRPAPGTEEFVRMYRSSEGDLAKLDEDQLKAMCSYAGPDWQRYPYNPVSAEARVWGCDACQGMKPHHDGICILFDDSSVRFFKVADLKGQDGNRICVGPGSGDPRLEKMVFFPGQR